MLSFYNVLLNQVTIKMMSDSANNKFNNTKEF